MYFHDLQAEFPGFYQPINRRNVQYSRFIGNQYQNFPFSQSIEALHLTNEQPQQPEGVRPGSQQPQMWSRPVRMENNISQSAFFTPPLVRQPVFTPGTPLLSHVDNIVHNLIPTNFVPLGQQLLLIRRAGIEGCLLDMAPGHFVFVPHMAVSQPQLQPYSHAPVEQRRHAGRVQGSPQYQPTNINGYSGHLPQYSAVQTLNYGNREAPNIFNNRNQTSYGSVSSSRRAAQLETTLPRNVTLSSSDAYDVQDNMWSNEAHGPTLSHRVGPAIHNESQEANHIPSETRNLTASNIWGTSYNLVAVSTEQLMSDLHISHPGRHEMRSEATGGIYTQNNSFNIDTVTGSAVNTESRPVHQNLINSESLRIPAPSELSQQLIEAVSGLLPDNFQELASVLGVYSLISGASRQRENIEESNRIFSGFENGNGIENEQFVGSRFGMDSSLSNHPGIVQAELDRERMATRHNSVYDEVFLNTIAESHNAINLEEDLVENLCPGTNTATVQQIQDPSTCTRTGHTYDHQDIEEHVDIVQNAERSGSAAKPKRCRRRHPAGQVVGKQVETDAPALGLCSDVTAQKESKHGVTVAHIEDQSLHPCRYGDSDASVTDEDMPALIAEDDVENHDTSVQNEVYIKDYNNENTDSPQAAYHINEIQNNANRNIMDTIYHSSPTSHDSGLRLLEDSNNITEDDDTTCREGSSLGNLQQNPNYRGQNHSEGQDLSYHSNIVRHQSIVENRQEIPGTFLPTNLQHHPSLYDNLSERAWRNRMYFETQVHDGMSDLPSDSHDSIAGNMMSSILYDVFQSVTRQYDNSPAIVDQMSTIASRLNVQQMNVRNQLASASNFDWDIFQRSSPVGSLRQYFHQLNYQFYFETYLWMYNTVASNPTSVGTWALLQLIGNIVGQTTEDVTVAMLAGFLEGSITSMMPHIDLADMILQEVETQRQVWPEAIGTLRDLAVLINIRLDPRALLHRFSDIVRQAARNLLMDPRTHTYAPESSPGTRRQSARERRHREGSPEGRAFQPPLPAQHIHPASLPPQHHQQQPILVDVDRVQTANPASMAPYAIPVCTGQHMPICTSAAHIPVCAANGQPTWSFPACSMQLPTCNIQHIPVCSLPQLPLPTHHPQLPQLFAHAHHQPHNSIAHQQQQQHHHHHHHSHQVHHHQQQQQQAHYTTHHTQQQRLEEEAMLERVRNSAASFHLPPRGYVHQPTMNPSPPLILQEPAIHPSPHDIFGPFQRFYAHQRTLGRRSLRSFAPQPPPYPGFLLHFLAMLGNPPVPPYGRELHDDTTEENYEALLNLAERLGDAKPKGLMKAEIEQLPSYRFNGENPRNGADQTSCVVCMCDFENRQLLRGLPCYHQFHAKCVDKWLRTNRTCPICRADASEIGNQSD